MDVRQLRGVVFDFDGVVANTMPALTRLGRLTIQIHFDAHRHTAQLMYQKTCGLPFIQQLQELFGKDDPRISAAADYFESCKVELMPGASEFSDIYPLITYLRKHTPAKIGLCSSTRGELIKDFLARKGILLAFDFVNCIENGPKSEQLKQFSRKMEIPSKDILFLGDSDKDAEFAAAASVQFRRVLPDRKTIAELQT